MPLILLNVIHSEHKTHGAYPISWESKLTGTPPYIPKDFKWIDDHSTPHYELGLIHNMNHMNHMIFLCNFHEKSENS